MYKAKHDILWFKKGQEVEEIQDNWKPYFEEVKAKVEKKVEAPKPKAKPSFKKKH